ncbi:MAG: ATP synthase F0 subunit B [Acidobacteriaceae bacterium]|nr:ATP synthase F0 subunit B [Acidobacteriaceae bacterium]MBV9033740.1 ATP synthase F0 subunit B [Acidobacteriaceae bacterium]MBV9222572.1 ATP synthase F0 subunit B [Acidobacteriaceae bacterium]MBV9305829.1 ATP synthase F0 subunit B [Acidobacteriaceae bacterium]MBV9679713.1 ATP synthase F0 subunit B [Acidobacteriaceae bacterium]
MDSTLHALANLLLQAIPTVIFFLFLTFYLKRVYFGPLAQVLEQRRKETEGVRELSQRAFEAADQKSSEFERALQLARAEINAENEALRQKWAQEQMETIAKARSEAEARIAQAKGEVAAETKRAQSELEANVQPLSEQIVQSLLRRRAA